MRAYDLILKKRNGGELTREEIEFLIDGFVREEIPDYQMAAFAMAVYFKGMNKRETLDLTMAMAASGEQLSLKAISGVKVDKHSTGGVGDTTTLVLAPLVAAAGIPVAKMSGRGLGHTGGTIDKFEAIPGFRTELPVAEMLAAVNSIKVAVVGQTGNLVPADKKLYALRDVTATVDSLPLIASSIMSKKLAAGADALVLDVKAGSGAFLKSLDEAFELAQLMVSIGEGAGRATTAYITNMDQPLGKAVGNALEMEEAILTLKGEGPRDLEDLCLVLGGGMLELAGAVSNHREGEKRLQALIDSGAALAKFREFIRNQGGDDRVAEDFSLFPKGGVRVEVSAAAGGYVQSIQAEAVGTVAMVLGAGRTKQGDKIDAAAGVVLEKKVGDRINKGETLAVMHTNYAPDSREVSRARELLAAAYLIKDKKQEIPPLLLGRIDKEGITRGAAR